MNSAQRRRVERKLKRTWPKGTRVTGRIRHHTTAFNGRVFDYKGRFVFVEGSYDRDEGDFVARFTTYELTRKT